MKTIKQNKTILQQYWQQYYRSIRYNIGTILQQKIIIGRSTNRSINSGTNRRSIGSSTNIIIGSSTIGSSGTNRRSIGSSSIVFNIGSSILENILENILKNTVFPNTVFRAKKRILPNTVLSYENTIWYNYVIIVELHQIAIRPVKTPYGLLGVPVGALYKKNMTQYDPNTR